MKRIRRHGARRRHFTLPLSAILLVLVLCGFGGEVHAAPVTLQFDAIVGPPRQGFISRVPPSWGISLQQGDIISGMFTFEPVDAATNVSRTMVIQPFDFSLQISTRTLTTSQYGIEVGNNILAVDDEDLQPNDSIQMGCSFGGAKVCTPRTISSGDATEWAFELGLGDSFQVLDGADIPSDPAVWQQFHYSGLIVSFYDRLANRYYGFSATPRSLREVPEPSTVFIALFGLSSVFTCWVFPRFVRSRHRV